MIRWIGLGSSISIGLAMMILAFGLAILADTHCTPGEEDIYGVWRGEREGRELMVAFNPDATCEISFTDEVSGTVETLKGDFEMDFSKRPVPLSIRNIPSLDHPMHTILEFAGGNTIRMAPFARRWRLRPVSFDRTRSVNLTRDSSDQPPRTRAERFSRLRLIRRQEECGQVPRRLCLSTYAQRVYGLEMPNWHLKFRVWWQRVASPSSFLIAQR